MSETLSDDTIKRIVDKITTVNTDTYETEKEIEERWVWEQEDVGITLIKWDNGYAVIDSSPHDTHGDWFETEGLARLHMRDLMDIYSLERGDRNVRERM